MNEADFKADTGQRKKERQRHVRKSSDYEDRESDANQGKSTAHVSDDLQCYFMGLIHLKRNECSSICIGDRRGVR